MIPSKALSFEGSDNITICIFFFFHRFEQRESEPPNIVCPEVNHSFGTYAIRAWITGPTIILTYFSNLLFEMSPDQ